VSGSLLAQAGDRPLIDWDWIRFNADRIFERIVEHVVLTGIAVGVGLLVAIGLALIALRHRPAYGPITAFTNVLYTIPSLALFAALVPITGLTVLTAEIGLVGYTLFILVRNIVAGIDGVPRGVTEAADGMGLTPRRRFWAVEVPLALPVIIAGVRIAAVTTVGLVTVTAVIGLGGLGFFILRGAQTFFWTSILVGTLGSVALAVAVDLGLLWVGRRLTPWERRVAR
jgi:osmoprotectant transport system permease protein